MYKVEKPRNSCMLINKSVEGETIEQKVERITMNNEPIKDGAPLVYTERKEGVNPAHNIRTDRFEIAIEGMDIIAKSVQAKREQKAQMDVVKDEPEGSRIQGTNEQTNN